MLYCENIGKSSKKLAFLNTKIFFDSANSFCQGSLVPVKNVHINVIPAGLSMNKYSFLQPLFNEVMDRIVTAGIPQHFTNFYDDLLFARFHESQEKLPKILTLHDLAFGFILWMIACGISIAGFIVEILSSLTVKIIKNSNC